MIAKFISHLKSNIKVYVRLVAMILFALILLFKWFFPVYDLVAFSIMFFMLVFDLLKRNHPKNQLEALAYYFFWIVIFFSIVLSMRLRFNYFDYPHDEPFLYFPLEKIVVIKLIVLVISYIRYKSIVVTKTMLSKLWLVITVMHFTELLLNSTFGFARMSFYLAIVSSIELLVIIFTEKQLLLYKSSVFEFLWKKK